MGHSWKLLWQRHTRCKGLKAQAHAPPTPPPPPLGAHRRPLALTSSSATRRRAYDEAVWYRQISCTAELSREGSCFSASSCSRMWKRKAAGKQGDCVYNLALWLHPSQIELLHLLC